MNWDDVQRKHEARRAEITRSNKIVGRWVIGLSIFACLVVLAFLGIVLLAVLRLT